MAILHARPCLPWPLYDDERNHLWHLQSADFVQRFEQQSWQVDLSLGRFEDDKYFLRVAVVSGMVPLRLMKEEIWAGTCCLGMPVHITLGYPRRPVCEAWLATMVAGEYKLELDKWTADPISSTYLPRGEVYSLCKQLEFYFEPRGQWHLSL